MFKRNLNIILPLVLFLVLAGCGGSKEQIIQENQEIQKNNEKEFMDHFIQGNVYELREEYDNAITEFLYAYKFNPHSAALHYVLGKNFWYIGNNVQAITYAKKAVDLDSNQIDYKLLLAEIYRTAGNTDLAAQLWEQIIAKDSNQIQSHYNLAKIYSQNKPLRAIEIYEKILEAIGPEWNVLAQLAQLKEQTGNYEGSIEAIKELLVMDPSNNFVLKVLADLYQRKNVPDSALVVINTILEEYPDDYEARDSKAKILLIKKDTVGAFAEYDRMMDQTNVPFDRKLLIGHNFYLKAITDSSFINRAVSYFNKIEKDTVAFQVKLYLGSLAELAKNDSVAALYYKEATELDAWNIDSWTKLSILHFDNKNYKDAIFVSKEGLKYYPDNYLLNYILGLSYSQIEDHKNAIEYLTKAVDANKKDANSLSALAFSYSRLRENEEAIKYFKMALTLNPNDIFSLGTLAAIYNGLGKTDESDSIYNLALKVDSSDALINNNYAYALSQREVRLDDALKMVDKALENNPYNTSYLDTKGWILFKMNRLEEAEKFILQAIEYGGPKSVILEHLGDVYSKMGKADKALERWKEALELDKNNIDLKNKIEKGEY